MFSHYYYYFSCNKQ